LLFVASAFQHDFWVTRHASAAIIKNSTKNRKEHGGKKGRIRKNDGLTDGQNKFFLLFFFWSLAEAGLMNEKQQANNNNS